MGLQRVREPRTPSATNGSGGDAAETWPQPKSSWLSLVGDEVILARCKRVGMASVEVPLETPNALFESSQKSSRDWLNNQERSPSHKRVHVRTMNMTNKDRLLSEGTIIGRGEPAVWASAIDDQKR